MTNRGGKRENARRLPGAGAVWRTDGGDTHSAEPGTGIHDFLLTLIAKRTQQNPDTVTTIFALSPAK